MIFKSASPDLDQKIESLINRRPDLVDAARNWIKDCEWSETEEDPENSFVDEIPPHRLFKLVHVHYDGGLKNFVGDYTR